MKFVLSIDCDNAAFKTDESPANATFEVARILTGLVFDLSPNNLDPITLKDASGNTVGRAEFVK